MTVTIETIRVEYTGAATPITGPYTFPFRIYSDTDMRVVKIVSGVHTEMVLNTDYTVSGAGLASGSITLDAVLPTDATLVIVRRLDRKQETDLRNAGKYTPESVETALDKQAMLFQQEMYHEYTSSTMPTACWANHLMKISVRDTDGSEQLMICVQDATNDSYNWQTFLTGGF